MAPLTEIVAAVVAHSSVAVLSHFGVVLEPPRIERAPAPAAERVVARTPRKAAQRMTDEPETPSPRPVAPQRV